MDIRSKLKRISIFRRLYFFYKRFEFLFYSNKLLSCPTWDLLWKYSLIAKSHNNHKFYERVLLLYDGINFSNIEAIEFIGDGAGSNSLNAYRKVHVQLNFGSYTCFEKIYRANSPQFVRMEWFYKNIFPVINNEIRVPKLLLVKGEKLKVSYFEWVENESENSIESEDIIEYYFKNLYYVFQNIKVNFSNKYSNFSHDEAYRINISVAKRWIKIHFGDIEVELFEKIEALIRDGNQFKKIFTHGDIGPSNIVNKTYLIDYDNWGFYPLGFEFAVILCKSYKVKSVEELEELFERYDILSNDESQKLPFWFFTFVFYTGGRAIILNKYLIKELFKRLMRECKTYKV